MLFKNTVVEAMGYALPEDVWTSDKVESLLAPAYERLRLPPGRLELMTGIRERRFWPVGKRPSEASAEAGERALAASSIDRDDIDLLIHSGVCRDRLEPSTASYVHRLLQLSEKTQFMDVSNACLGFLNAMVIAGGLIESGLIRTALIVSGENGRPLMENTLRSFLSPEQTRKSVKKLFANLTIGAGAVSYVLSRKDSVTQYLYRMAGSVVGSDSQANDLCEGDSAAGSELSMETDSEALLHAGVNLAKRTWSRFQSVMGWGAEQVQHVMTHQVGRAHQRSLYEALGLPLDKDFSTYETLGNVGSVSCPITLAMAEEQGVISSGDNCALLGIGSGLSSLMMGLERA